MLNKEEVRQRRKHNNGYVEDVRVWIRFIRLRLLSSREPSCAHSWGFWVLQRPKASECLYDYQLLRSDVIPRRI